MAISLVGLAIRGRAASFTFSSSRLAWTVAMEILLLAITVPRLRRRGWLLSHITLPFEVRDIIRGAGIWVLGCLVFIAGWLLAWAVSPAIALSMYQHPPQGAPALGIVVLISLLNPVYEELIWLGYAVPGPARWQPVLVVLWSAVPRGLIHAYQGWPALFVIAPLGLWYLRYYYRTGRLWPVVIAHGLQDLMSLGFLALRHAG